MAQGSGSKGSATSALLSAFSRESVLDSEGIGQVWAEIEGAGLEERGLPVVSSQELLEDGLAAFEAGDGGIGYAIVQEGFHILWGH